MGAAHHISRPLLTHAINLTATIKKVKSPPKQGKHGLGGGGSNRHRTLWVTPASKKHGLTRSRLHPFVFVKRQRTRTEYPHTPPHRRRFHRRRPTSKNVWKLTRARHTPSFASLPFLRMCARASQAISLHTKLPTHLLQHEHTLHPPFSPSTLQMK